MNRNTSCLLLVFQLLFVLTTSCGVEFTPSVTQMEWYTEQGQPFDTVPTGSSPPPTPTSIFSVPQPTPSFAGMDSLNCAAPKAGDDHYGYCRIPNKDMYYVWGPCGSTCPEGPYADFAILTVMQSDTLYNFINVIDKRDTAFKERDERYLRGGLLGGLGLPAGVFGAAELCILSGSWNGGVGCGLVLVALGVDAFIVGTDIYAGIEASEDLNEPLGLEESAEEIFGRLLSSEN